MVMIDTNIVSELMRAEPSAEVLSWMDEQTPRELFRDGGDGSRGPYRHRVVARG